MSVYAGLGAKISRTGVLQGRKGPLEPTPVRTTSRAQSRGERETVVVVEAREGMCEGERGGKRGRRLKEEMS